ncbi:hypothetical protein BKA62DRAFT_695173 [Auriculariales sp. MPI-PUGE-AT-0066]|nr:hypothetical protein BKA62DRAFT_695173 [Auriculariales sp. MPI-PUGE-AT-0066]
MMPQLAEEEEDDDSEDEEDVATATAATAAEDAAETIEQHKNAFTRLVRERLIYGLLEGFEYDDIDWNDSLDVDVDQQHEDAWFDADDDEEEAPMAVDRSATPDY